MIAVLREHRRWLVAGLLFFISTIAFLDRQTLSVLEKTLEEIFGFSAAEYSYIVMGFLIATGLGYLFAGGIIDRFGVRTSFAVALTVWSVAAVAHSLATGWISFLVLRVVLGLGESFYTPAAARVLRDWIPQRERGVCWAVFSTGNFIGAMIAPPLVAWLALHYHWQFSFVITGASGFVLLGVWLWFYHSPERQPVVVRCRADVYFAGPRVKRCHTGKHLHLSPAVPACGPQFLFHAFPHGSLYVFFPFLASRLSPNLPRFLPSKDRHDGLDSISRGRSWRFDRWGCLRLADSPWNGSAPGPATHSVRGGVSDAVDFGGCSSWLGPARGQLDHAGHVLASLLEHQPDDPHH